MLALNTWHLSPHPSVGPVFCIMALVVAPFQNWLLTWNATVFILDPGGMTYFLTGLKMYLKERKNM
jgi:hypothetical protein